MNLMGSHFNAVSTSIVNSECSEAYEAAFTATKKGLYAEFNLLKECGIDGCTLCQFIRRHDVKDFKTLLVDQLDAAPQKFPIAKPSSDNFSAFIKFAKKEFGKDAAIQQCCVYFTGNLLTYFLSDWCVCPAIAWKKKAYRSEFDNEKNYAEFTQLKK